MTAATHNPTNQRKNKMKYLLTAAVLALAAPAHAETATAEPETQDICQIIGILAGGVMEFRQDGIELSTVMSRLEENPDFSAEFKSVIRELAIEAYKTPIHFNPEAGIIEAASFRNEYELACYIEGADK
jgi:hypothetical protein